MKRTSIIFALMASVFVLGAMDPAAAQSRDESESSQSRDEGGRGENEQIGFAGNGGNRGETQAVIHDSDPQLDVWVTNCNDAGGGMSTDETGNYTCTGADGNEIEDY